VEPSFLTMRFGCPELKMLSSRACAQGFLTWEIAIRSASDQGIGSLGILGALRTFAATAHPVGRFAWPQQSSVHAGRRSTWGSTV